MVDEGAAGTGGATGTGGEPESSDSLRTFGAVVQGLREHAGLRPEAGIDIRVEDGGLGLRRPDTGSRDLVAGDAFGSVSVPWHLTTVEAMTGVRRVLDEDGLYVANLIDHGGLAFARAEVATLSETFEHVALTGEPTDIGLDPTAVPEGGNPVMLASSRPVDLRATQEALDARQPAGRSSPATTSPPGSATPDRSPTATHPSTNSSSPRAHGAADEPFPS
ncbi:hypothetical protein GCM10027162_03210 [Streptomyces incanus]